MKFENDILKAQVAQELHLDAQIEGTDVHTFLKCFHENLQDSYDRESFQKSWSSDLQKRFPNGSFKTINGAAVFINGGKVVAGLGGFNGAIDEFFSKKEQSKQVEKKEKGKYKHVVQFEDNTYTVINHDEKLNKVELRKIAGNPSKIKDFTVTDMGSDKKETKEQSPKEEIGSANLRHRSNVIKEKYNLTREESNAFLIIGSRIAWEKAKGEGDKVKGGMDKEQYEALVDKGLLTKDGDKYGLTPLGKKERDWRENVSEIELEDKQEEKKEKPVNETGKEENLTSVERALFDNGKKRFSISESKSIEIRDKIIQADKGKTNKIEALAEAMMYDDGESHVEDYFGDSSDEAIAVIKTINGEISYHNARRILDIGVGGKLEKKAKDLIDKHEKIKDKVKQLGLNSSGKQLLKVAVEKLSLSLDKTLDVLNGIEGKTVMEVAEAINRIGFASGEPMPSKKNKSKNTVSIDTFKDVAKQSKDAADFIKRTREIKNVPPEVAKEFFDKYGKDKSQEQAAVAFMKEHGNKGVADVDLKKQVEERRAGKRKEIDLPF